MSLFLLVLDYYRLLLREKGNKIDEGDSGAGMGDKNSISGVQPIELNKIISPFRC